MKAPIIGTALLISALVVIWYAVSFLHTYTDDVNSGIDYSVSMYQSGDKSGAKAEIERIYDELKDNKTVLCLILDHIEYNEAEIALLRLTELAQSDEAALFYAECSALKARIDNIYNSELLTLSNIF